MSHSQEHAIPDFRAINLACGGKLCRQSGWINADHSPSTKEVMRINLLKPLPFADNTFDVVYHSQFIEHLPMEIASAFLAECYRVLKPSGVLRVVTPDLGNQAAEYLRNLQAVLNDRGDEDARLRYEWIRLEMMDQLARHKSGGDMVGFLHRFGQRIRGYLHERLGRSGDEMIPPIGIGAESTEIKHILRRLKRRLIGGISRVVPDSCRVGRFRLSGESHLCMYDQYLLSTLLASCRFVEIKSASAKESRILDWNSTLLDCDSQGNPDCPTSLFMEAVKVAPELSK